MTSELLPISLFETSVSRDVWSPQITPDSNFRKKYDEKMVTVNRASAMESINKINLFFTEIVELSRNCILSTREWYSENDTRARAAVILPRKCCLQIPFPSNFACVFFPVLILFGTKMYGTIVVPHRPFFFMVSIYLATAFRLLQFFYSLLLFSPSSLSLFLILFTLSPYAIARSNV